VLYRPALGLLLLAAPLAAQSRPHTYGGIVLQLAQPEGEFAQFVNTGYGVGVNATFFLDEANQAGIRIFGSWIEYGRTTERLPLSPTLPGLLVDLTTSNDIWSLAVGPELHLLRGPIRPYLQGAIGFSIFSTTTSAKGSNNSTSFASTNNFNDWTLAYYGGGGLLVRVSNGRRPVYIDGGARYQAHGRTRYLREGSIQVAPGGGVSFSPIESQTDILVIHLGVQFGL